MGGLEGPPNPPALGDVPAKPGRPSITAPLPRSAAPGEAGTPLDHGPTPPARRRPAKPGRPLDHGPIPQLRRRPAKRGRPSIFRTLY
jgi:hypothetical protein